MDIGNSAARRQRGGTKQQRQGNTAKPLWVSNLVPLCIRRSLTCNSAPLRLTSQKERYTRQTLPTQEPMVASSQRKPYRTNFQAAGRANPLPTTTSPREVVRLPSKPWQKIARPRARAPPADLQVRHRSWRVRSQLEGSPLSDRRRLPMSIHDFYSKLMSGKEEGRFFEALRELRRIDNQALAEAKEPAQWSFWNEDSGLPCATA